MRNTTPMTIAKTGYIIMSAILIICGIIMITAPDISAEIICRTIGITASVFGAVKLMSYFSKDLFRLAFQFDLAAGILLLTLGITMSVRPDIFIGMFGMILGIVILADGLFKIQTAVDAKAFGVSKWWLILLAALIACTAGFLLMIDPIDGATAAVLFAGISMLADGILNLVTVITAVKIIKNQRPDSEDKIVVNAVHYTH